MQTVETFAPMLKAKLDAAANAKKVISNKSAKGQKLIDVKKLAANDVDMAAAGEAYDKSAELEATIYDAVVAKAEAKAAEKAKAALEKLQVKEALAAKKAADKALARDGANKAKQALKEQAAKERIANYVPSAFGTAIKIMCENPDLTFKELKEQCAAKGFDKVSAERTAHAQFNKVYKLLNANGFIK